MFEVKIEYKYSDTIIFQFQDILTATEFMRFALPAAQSKEDRFDTHEILKPVITLTEVVEQLEVKTDENESN